ncbi:MAG: Unknown protein [uncultured Thiotrichaceae bacterium]|uniref:DUF4332 domain-containing protein n=1 Tax=uncultured Thiotrichaceae bacterium TaxID=298394 RepID=A0A6S6U307_9GAMM|nr:MAG: Unknown protein [uncultured Thiotrichaceae bacterium]
MTEVISQIWFGILLAGIIGGITGWFLRDNGKKRIEELEKSWEERYEQLMQEKTSCQEKIKHLHVVKHERNALSNKLKRLHGATKRHAGLEARLTNLHQALEKKNQQYIEEHNNLGLLQRKIAKMQAMMHEKDTMIHKITEKLTSAGVMNTEKQQYVEQLEQETSSLQQRLANSEKKLMANDAQIQQLMLNTEQNTTDEMERSQIDVEEFEKSQNEITELRSSLDAANVRIQADQEKISRLVGELPVMAKHLHQSQEEIRRRDDEVIALQNILEGKELSYQKVDSKLDESRMFLLDADSKIEVLYDALDQERDKNRQINADNKLKDYRLSEYAEDAENKALEIHALYEKLTSAEFDLIERGNDGTNSPLANNLLTAHADEVEHERQQLLKKCDVIESELGHYKSKLESKDQQLEVQKVVNRKLREELGRIQGKESSAFEEKELVADIPVNALADESDSIALDDSEQVELVESLEEGSPNNSEDVAQSIYDEPQAPLNTEAFAVSAEARQNIEGEENLANKSSHLTAGLLSGATVGAAASQIVDYDGDSKVDSQEDQERDARSADSDVLASMTNDVIPEASEDMGQEKLAILGWYGDDVPKINLLRHGAGYSNVEEKPHDLSLEKLDGMSDAKISKLKAYGITSIHDLHEFAKTTKGKHSALTSKIHDDEWKEWCSHADLMRVDGMNITECKILNELDVFSVEDLSKVGVSELKGKIHQLKRRQKIAAAIGPNTVSNWVNASKELMQLRT